LRGRASAEQAATLLGLEPQHIQLLVVGSLLRPSGKRVAARSGGRGI
jgi:hypothetical protein